MIHKFKHPNDYKPGEIIIPAEDIDGRIKELAQKIARDFAGKQVLVVGLLTGAAWFTVDLFSGLHGNGLTDAELAFMKVASYPSGIISSHEPRIEYDLPVSPHARNILLVDDIADTGKSLFVVEKYLKSKDAKLVKSVVLLDKPSRREVVFKPDYVGFTIPNIWVQGRGMDSNGFGRGDPNIIKGPYTY